MKRIALVFGVLLLASTAQAQTGALVSATLQIYQSGAPMPTQVTTIPLPSGALCAQPLLPALPPAVFNPTRIVWTDPQAPGTICIAVQGAFLLSIPLGNTYTATLTFTDDRGLTSPVSNISNPFSRVAPPNAPTGVQVRP